VIPTFERPAFLESCLQALAHQSSPPREIVVVGRDGDGGTKSAFDRIAAESRIPMAWVSVDRPGHLPPVIAGFAAASTSVVALLDDDAEPTADWLHLLTRPFVDDRVAVVGGQYVTPGHVSAAGRAEDAGRLRWYGKFVGHFADIGTVESLACDGVLEGTSAWRKEVVDRVKFDDFFLKGDAFHFGLDLCMGAKELGYAVLYVPGAQAIHHWASRVGDSQDRTATSRAYIAGRNMTYIGLKHLHGIRRAAFVVWWFLVGERQSYGLLKALADSLCQRRGVVDRSRAALQGRVDGTKGWLSRRPRP
jgi:GT2 family glycosyltransferase